MASLCAVILIQLGTCSLAYLHQSALCRSSCLIFLYPSIDSTSNIVGVDPIVWSLSAVEPAKIALSTVEGRIFFFPSSPPALLDKPLRTLTVRPWV